MFHFQSQLVLVVVYRMWAAGHGKVCVAVPGAGWYAVTKVHVVGECITLLLEVVSVTVCS